MSRAGLAAAVGVLALAIAGSASAQSAPPSAPRPAPPPAASAPVERLAAGTFDVRLTPAPADPFAAVDIAKTFHGDLDATSVGRMLSVRSADGSGGYVAIERVTGSLGGRRGGFALQHSGTMAGGARSLDVRVVPGSGGGALAGLAGTMDIVVDAGRHGYTFRYTLPN